MTNLGRRFGCTALALASLGLLGASAKASDLSPSARLHAREIAAIGRYARRQRGTVYGCRIAGRHGQAVICTSSFPTYMEPGHELLGDETSLDRAYYEEGWNEYAVVRVSPWTLTYAPGISGSVSYGGPA